MARGIISSNGKEWVASTDVEYRGIPNAITQRGIGFGASVGQNQLLTAHNVCAGRINSYTITNQLLVARSIWFPRNCTVYGFAFLFTTLPSASTINNTNAIALYTADATNLTLACNTSSDDINNNIWKQNSGNHSAGQWGYLQLTTPYSATAGQYWLALLRNTSSQTGTAATWGGQAVFNAAVHALPGMGNMRLAWSLASQTSLPSTQAWTGVTAATTAPLIHPIGDWA